MGAAGAGVAQKLLPTSGTVRWSGLVEGPLPWSLQIQSSLSQLATMPNIITAAAAGDYPSSVQLEGELGSRKCACTRASVVHTHAGAGEGAVTADGA